MKIIIIIIIIIILILILIQIVGKEGEEASTIANEKLSGYKLEKFVGFNPIVKRLVL